VGQRYEMNRRSKEIISQSVSETKRGRYALQVGVIVSPQVWLKRIKVTAYITKGATSFSRTHS